jgi:hypothetical protein
VTDLPSHAQVEEYKKNNFRGSPVDFSHYTRLLKHLGCKRVIDYGCSWGYGAYQFANSGLIAHGLEVSLPRAEFGRKELGVVPIYSSTKEVLRQEPLYDAIFTSHVLEHLPSPRIALSFFEKISKQGTFLIIEVPNCSGKDAREEGVHWGPFNSAIHPLSYTWDFFTKSLPNHNFKILFSPEKKEFVNSENLREVLTPPSQPQGNDMVIIAQHT